MATEVMKGYNDLQQELDRARCNLKGLNDNIRRIFGRDPANAEQYNNGRDDTGGPYTPNGGNKKSPAVKDLPYADSRKRSSLGFDSPHHGMGPRRDHHGRPYPDLGQNPAKRRAIGETKSVFSRLSGPPNRDVDYEKPRILSRIIKEQPSKEDIVAAQGSDERSRARNRRIFGSLLGTLQKFSQEESKLKSKEEKKAMIEKKLEEQEKAERENMLKEKQCLFTDRKRQQLEIRALETKMAMLKALEMWENSKRPLQNFIKTKTNPPIYYLPKRMNAAMEKKLAECQQEPQKMLEEKRQEVMESIEAVEARFRADIKSLEENDPKDRSHGGGYERVKSSGSFDESLLVVSGGTKHDRSKLDDDEEDDDPHSTYHYEQDEQLEVPEGPALPASMASRFKITILNTDLKHDTTERRDMPAEESKPIRLLSADGMEVDASVTEMDEDSEGVGRRKTSIDRTKNIQITFRTSVPEDN
ncbi:pinin [Anopheles maculipalpis]|uniref:pinin n=1 Tax=Anopheles maculipalpis TaxID=1496333 RepID=UPI002158FB5E|nr:pinin [Anopheles maculipalpis]